MPSKLKISVVIPTYNRRELLGRTLEPVLSQDFPVCDYEVVVVVDGSSDGTVEFAKSVKAACEINVIEQGNCGQAAARNAGVRAARGELILFLDDDVKCGPDLLKEHWNSHDKGGRLVVVGAVAPDASLTTTLAAWREVRRERELLERMERGQLIWPHDIFVGLNCSVPRDLLNENGGFNEDFGIREDCEFGLRLWKAGVAFQPNPRARVLHMGVKGTTDYATRETLKFVQSELMISSMYPEYRVRSPMVNLFNDSRLYRAAMRLASRASGLCPTLAVACKLTERFIRIPAARWLGTLLLRVWAKINFVHYSVEVAGSWKSLERKFGVLCPALLYHNVGMSVAGEYPEITVPLRVFEGQMQWLADHGYHPILPAQWAGWRERGAALPDRPVLLTFDDGYASVKDNVLPVLQRFGFPAAIFVPSALIGGKSEWDVARGWTPIDLMNAADLHDLAPVEFEIGAHTRDHEDLRTLESEELTRQVIDAADELERITGRKVTSFSYPYGLLSDIVVAAARTKYCTAFTCDDGLNYLGTDPMLLRRTMVRPGDNMRNFASRVRFGRSISGEFRYRLKERLRQIGHRLRLMIRHGVKTVEGTPAL